MTQLVGTSMAIVVKPGAAGACGGATPVTANFVGTPRTGNASLAVAFSDTSTGNAFAWLWTFGDGGTSSVQNPTYTYTIAGTYDVSLSIVTGGGPSSVTKVGYVTVTSATVCVTDPFTRTVSPGLGTGPLGTWITPTTGAGYPTTAVDAAFAVNGSAGVLTSSATGTGTGFDAQVIYNPTGWALPMTVTWHYSDVVNVPLPHVQGWSFSFYPTKNFFASTNASVDLYTNPGNGGNGSANLGLNVDAYQAIPGTIDPSAAGALTSFSGRGLSVKIEVTTSTVSGKFWFDGDPEPGSYAVSSTAGSTIVPPTTLIWYYTGDTYSPGSIQLDSLEICS